MEYHSKVRAYRLKNGWSQEQLAALSALSVRTIQRVENGEKASLETLSALAAVFQISVHDISDESIGTEDAMDSKILEAESCVKQEIHFYTALASYVLVCSILGILNFIFTPHKLWVIWPIATWGLYLFIVWLRLFIFSQKLMQWQKMRVQKLLRK